MKPENYSFETPYQEFIYKRSYARWNFEEKRREDWHESVKRYFDFFRNKLSGKALLAFNSCEPFLLERKVMPSMRVMWTAGSALEQDNIAAYNCAYTVIDSPKAFAEVLYILMHGTGIGFSVERQYVNQLPNVPSEIKKSTDVLVFEDSKLGWAEGYYKFLLNLFEGKELKYDLSKIRPMGTLLKTFGGRASGPMPLKQLLDFTAKLFNNAKGRKLESIECHDICCYIANIVVSGGVRRSSLISLSNLSDRRMRDAKEGQFWMLHPYRQLSNNSVAYTERPDMAIFMEEWITLAKSGTGERGIFNRESARKIIERIGRRDPNHDWGTNPCFTGDTLVAISDGTNIFKTLKELADDIKEYKVYCFDNDGKLTTRYMRDARKTGNNEKILRVTLDNGEVIRCTEKHEFRKNNMEWCRADQLKKGDQLKTLVVNGEEGRVVDSVDFSGYEDVYCGNVDEFHNFCVGGKYYQNPKGFDSWSFVNVKNCSEILLRKKSFCNLSEVIVRPNDTLDDLCEKVKVATIFGCVQSTLTNFKFLDSEWKKNCEEERLLGVSLTGVCDHPILSESKGKERMEDWLSTMKQMAIKTAKKWSNLLNINMPTAITCCKPSGTISQLTNTASGLHPRYAPYYIRRVRVSKSDPICKFLQDKGVLWNPEVGQSDKDYSTAIFDFPIKAPKNSIFRNDKTAIQQLEFWKSYQLQYCEHKPSITIYVKEEEWLEVGAWAYKNWDIVSGISFLPFDGGIYQLAPYEELSEEQYKHLLKAMPILNFKELAEYESDDYTSGAKEVACVGNSCEL